MNVFSQDKASTGDNDDTVHVITQKEETFGKLNVAESSKRYIWIKIKIYNLDVIIDLKQTINLIGIMHYVCWCAMV